MAGKTLESMKSVSIDDIWKYFSTATIIKDFMLKDGYKPTFFQNNQVLATVWERPSLRTRVSFETGFQALGGGVITLKAYPPGAADIIFKEDVRDQANVLESMCDLVMARTYSHDTITKLGAAMDIPLINGMSDMAHPVQQLTDLFTTLEHKGYAQGPQGRLHGRGHGQHRSGLAHRRRERRHGLRPRDPGLLATQASPGSGFRHAGSELGGRGAEARRPDWRLDHLHERSDRGRQGRGRHLHRQLDRLRRAGREGEGERDPRDLPALPGQRSTSSSSPRTPSSCTASPCTAASRSPKRSRSHPQCVVSAQAENRYHLQKGVMVELLKPIA